MNARDKFRKGQRVRMTDVAVEIFPRSPRTGRVVGFGYEPHRVVIVGDGNKTRVAWHMDFWEPLIEGGTRGKAEPTRPGDRGLGVRRLGEAAGDRRAPVRDRAPEEPAPRAAEEVAQDEDGTSRRGERGPERVAEPVHKSTNSHLFPRAPHRVEGIIVERQPPPATSWWASAARDRWKATYEAEQLRQKHAGQEKRR